MLFCFDPSGVLTMVCLKRADLPVRFVTLLSLGDIVRSVSLSASNTVSWILEVSGQDHAVLLNSIEDSSRDTFVLARRDSEKVLLQ